MKEQKDEILKRFHEIESASHITPNFFKTKNEYILFELVKLLIKKL